MGFSFEQLNQAWQEHEGPAIFATVDQAGVPNAIYVTCVGLHPDGCFVVADNYFCKTRSNLQAGGTGSLLFMDKSGKTYQIKGSLSYQTQGGFFDFMKSWNPAKHPGLAAAVLKVEQVFSGAEQLI